MTEARVYPVHIAGESKPEARLIDARTFRAGERCRVRVDGRWRDGEVLPHPDGVRTSATIHVRVDLRP